MNKLEKINKTTSFPGKYEKKFNEGNDYIKKLKEKKKSYDCVNY